jgi:hypothetical protein
VLCSESTSCAGAVALWQPRVASLGLNWGGYVQVAAAAPSYTSSCLTLQQNGSNFVELAVAAQVAVRVIKACKQQGFVPDHYGVATASFDGPALAPLTTGGAAITGVLVGFPWWTDTAPAKQYRDVMSKYGPKKLKSENDAQSNTWTALEMFRKAMANASDNPTSAEVEQAMDNVKDEDLGGLLPEKVSFTAGQPSKVINCVWRGELSDGKYSAGETQCLSPSSAGRRFQSFSGCGHPSEHDTARAGSRPGNSLATPHTRRSTRAASDRMTASERTRTHDRRTDAADR